MFPLLIVLFAPLIFSCESLEKVAYNLFLEEDLLKRPKAKRCADCHQKIYDQWKNSRHSLAWISEHFKKSTNNYSKVKCLSCHAPYEIEVLEKPKLRDFHREDGINCVSCHFKDKTNSMHGPYDVFSPPHYSTKDENYIKSEICAGCHKETYKQWKNASVKDSCQVCHMPSKKDNLIQKFPFYLFHRKKEVHNHSFPVLKASQEDISVKIKKEKDSITVYIKNEKIPHNLPTADQGKPKWYVKLKLYRNKQIIYEDQNMITHKEGIPYKEEREIQFYIYDDYDNAEVEIYRKLSWSSKKEKILTLKVE